MARPRSGEARWIRAAHPPDKVRGVLQALAARTAVRASTCGVLVGFRTNAGRAMVLWSRLGSAVQVPAVSPGLGWIAWVLGALHVMVCNSVVDLLQGSDLKPLLVPGLNNQGLSQSGCGYNTLEHQICIHDPHL